MGAQIQGAGTSTIRVRGVTSLHGARYRINPDRIEAGTFLIAGAITGGDLIVANCNTDHLGAVIAKLRESGVRVDVLGPNAVRVRAAERLRAADISTEEYPGFPTDMQAQYMALATQAEGVSLVRENIFENRFMHVQELVRMGANIKVDGNTRHGARSGAALLGRRHVLRSARLRFAGAGRAGRRRRVRHRSRVPHGPRLRALRGKAAQCGRADPAHGQCFRAAPGKIPCPWTNPHRNFASNRLRVNRGYRLFSTLIANANFVPCALS